MSIVNNYIFKNLRLKLSNANYWDLVLSSDLNGYDDSTLYCDDIISGDTLLVTFDFNDINTLTGNTIYSLDTWKNSILPKSGLTLCDIGLTGVDNGFVPNLTGETLYLSSGDSRFFMTKVTGQTYSYPISYSSDTSGNYSKFCGGFYQGFYKLENYPIKSISDNKFLDRNLGKTNEDCCLTINCDCGCQITPPEEPNPVIDYQVLPNKFSRGWTAEFWIKREGCNIVTPKNILNDVYPNNEGIFYTIGLRSENKFWDVFSGETGLTTCLNTAHTLSPPMVSTDPMSGMNPFMFYGRYDNVDDSCDICNTCEKSSSYQYYQEKNYISDIVDNIIGFRITNDGSIGYRKLSFSGQCSGSTIDCCKTSGGTYVTGYTVEESYSLSGMVPTDKWTHVAVRYKADYSVPEDELDCPCSELNKQYCPRPGELSFFVNGYLKHRVRPVIEMVPRGLDDYPEKQLGVPYTMSLGGGTQGLIETKTFGGTDYKDFELPIQENFAGSFIGGISKFRFYSEPLDVTKLRCNFYYDMDRYGIDTFIPSNFHTPINTPQRNLNLHVMAEYLEGSIIAKYSAFTETVLNTDLNLSFTNKLHVKNGSQIQVNPQITIKSGETMGTTELIINDDFNRLNGNFEINTFNYTGIDTVNVKTSTNVTIKPINIPNPPPPVTNSIYYGKLRTNSFNISGFTYLNKIDTDDARNMYLTLPLEVGYGYILIPNTITQPTLFRNSNESCAGFVIPMVEQGTVTNVDLYGNSIIYNIYRTFVSTRAQVDVWLCD